MDSTPTTFEQQPEHWLDRPLFSYFRLNWENILFLTIIILAVLTRFYNLEPRVMSHDETSHVYFSWRLFRGDGYQHDPITHGPFQFHIVALSYFMFGDNDFSARIPVVLFGIVTIALLWYWRRYLGRVGALLAAFFMLISPYMLYYQRYVRNESYVALYGVVLLWATLRYFESGKPRYLYWLTAATVMHFATKETAFIYSAQLLLFLGFFLVWRVLSRPWPYPQQKRYFLIALLLGFTLFAAALTVGLLLDAGAVEAGAAATVPGEMPEEGGLASIGVPALSLLGLSLLSFLAALFFLLRGYTPAGLKGERSFDMLLLHLTLILPMLAPFPVFLAGWNPTDYSSAGMLRTAVFLVPIALISIGAGLWWNPRLWLGNAALYYTVFTVLYTTLFTNGGGFFTGMIGSLGYWLKQQEVQRGSQPWYYYLLVQVPLYEYLPAIGSLMAVGLAVKRWVFGREQQPVASLEEEPQLPEPEPTPENPQRLAVILLAFWAVTSLFAYSYAGEKMPWLTVHITLPMILLAGWGIGQLVESTPWRSLLTQRGALTLLLLPVFLLSLFGLLASLLGPNPPFQGKNIGQLQASMTFVTALLTAIGSGWGLMRLIHPWAPGTFPRLYGLTFFALLAVLTARTAMAASYRNYDLASEYLVYAHTGPGPKQALEQIEEISQRTTNGLALQVAYDNDTTYPYWWYLRNYTSQKYYGENPSRELRDAPVILVGQDNYTKIEPVVGQAYHRFSYIRMWWPNQDYFGLTWARIWDALRNPQMRQALFEIWLNRDHSTYSEVVGRDLSLPKWQPSAEMRMYVRKDIAAQIWNYGSSPVAEEIVADPYEGKEVKLTADIVFGQPGTEAGQFQRPRDLAVAPDGTLYVADTLNHRIQHLARDGSVLHTWGGFATGAEEAAPTGLFNEPWGVAVGPDGAVYVTDTWNNRIQKFTAEGEFIATWGFAGQAETEFALYGPRDIAVDNQGRVYVTDTGNKRILVYTANGEFVAQFGDHGMGPGQFDEPVGVAVDSDGQIYVADTWNQRIQIFRAIDENGQTEQVQSIELAAWYGQSLENKPYLAVDGAGHIFATDPEGYRILEFDANGEFVRFWGDYSPGPDGFGIAGSVAIDPLGGVWVSDPGNNRLLHFIIPEEGGDTP